MPVRARRLMAVSVSTVLAIAGVVVAVGTPAGAAKALPHLSVAPASTTEGNSGTKSMVFTVTATAASKGTMSVSYATADGTAAAGSDYVATKGTVHFAAGATSATFAVPILGDTVFEPDETFTVALSKPAGALLDTKTTTGTIVNDDAARPVGLATGSIFWNLDAASQDAELADLQSIGTEWLRTTLFWRAVQPVDADHFDWSVADAIVADASRHHIKLIWQVTGAPLWAVPGSVQGQTYEFPPDPTLYATFVEDAVARYAPLGVTAYELGNSPNLVNDSNPNPDPAFYTSLLCDTYPAVKSVASGVTVLTGGVGGTRDSNGNYSASHWVAALYADGAKGCFDAVAMHPYTYPQLPPDDGTRSWSQMLTARQTMVDNGDGAKQIWATEYGAPTNGTDGVTEAEQAQMLDVAYRLWSTYSWTGPFCWFQYKDKGTDPTDHSDWFGLLRYDGSHKPAYATYATDSALAAP
jgi:hypothetical protein